MEKEHDFWVQSDKMLEKTKSNFAFALLLKEVYTIELPYYFNPMLECQNALMLKKFLISAKVLKRDGV